MATGRVVVGYDGSHFSRNALSWGLRAAQARGIPLLIAHAGTTPTPFAGFVTLLEPNPETVLAADRTMVAEAGVAARLEVPGVDVSAVAVDGPVVPALLGLMADAELGVVGCRGLGTFAELLVGSTSVRLAAHVTCPLVVVRTTYYAVPGPDAGRVVVGVDASPGASTAVDFAFEEARLRGCGVTALHAWDLVGREVQHASSTLVEHMVGEEERKVRLAMNDWLAPWTDDYPTVDVRRRLIRGGPAAALVDASAGAALVVVGAAGVGGFRSLSLGSVSHAVIHHARSPVAVTHLRHEGHREEPAA